MNTSKGLGKGVNRVGKKIKKIRGSKIRPENNPKRI